MADKSLIESLNPKQKQFVHFYVREWNATQSYHKAYGQQKNDNVAAVSASDLLRNPKIKEYIEEYQKDLAKAAGISKLTFLDELKCMAKSSLHHYKDGWMTLKDWEAISEEDMRAVKKFKRTTKMHKVDDGNGEFVMEDYEVVEFELHDKRGAIDSVFKAMGWNEPDKVDVTDKSILDGLPLDDKIAIIQQIEKARQKSGA